MSLAPASLFIGHDSREDEVYRVCAHSVKKRTHMPLTIQPIKLEEMRAKGLYHRPTEQRGNQLWDVISDAPMSTEFAISRFLTPHLSTTPWAVFCDCDFLFLEDIQKLFALADPRYAVMCVQHNHKPPEATKMDNQVQLQYARKNWSSLMLWNCKHPSNAILTVDVINKVPGRDLHRFFWLKDEEIGALPWAWNWLEGHSDPHIKPSAIHYTRGGPWFAHMKECSYADMWLNEERAMRKEEK
jgi:lipopolysaccharide biosynthesis glycosyltransferase